MGSARTFMGAQKTKASAKQLTAATVDLYKLSVDFCTGVDRLIKTVLFTTLGVMAVIAGCVLLIFCVSVLACGGWQLNRVAPLLKRAGAVGVPTPAALQQQEAYALAMKTLGSSTLQRACMQAPAAHEPIVAGSAAAAGALCELPWGLRAAARYRAAHRGFCLLLAFPDAVLRAIWWTSGLIGTLICMYMASVFFVVGGVPRLVIRLNPRVFVWLECFYNRHRQCAWHLALKESIHKTPGSSSQGCQ